MKLGILVLLCLSTAAHANTRVVLMTDSADAAALQVALAGRGTEVVAAEAPSGELRLDRAASAQRTAVQQAAIAGVWIESEGVEVCVVSADGRLFRHAPLPVTDATPRVFAAIAASLLDELIVPPDAGVNVNVNVSVDVNGHPAQPATVATAEPMGPMMPPTHFITAPGYTLQEQPAQEEGVVRANRTLIEVGPMLSPITVGIEAEVAFPISERLRFGVLGGANVTFIDETTGVYMAGLEGRWVGRGRSHNDIGVLFGGASDGYAPIVLAGLRLEHVWEGPNHGIGLSLNPIIFVTGSNEVVPGIWTSLRWELPI